MHNINSAFHAPLLAVLMALPALVGTLGVGFIESRSLVSRKHPSRVDTSPQSMIAALESGQVERVHAIIRAGRDPSELVWYWHPDLTGGQAVRTAPLLIAVARRDENMVMTLLSAGAGRDLREDWAAACLAESLAEPGLADTIRRGAGKALAECAAPRSAPPLAFGGESDGSAK